ncbi:MAG TPA: hypothetical protein VG013_02575 [Gemmataceae bacterium]|nr:hypothetical protein [Gemmataceae bacterium]
MRPPTLAVPLCLLLAIGCGEHREAAGRRSRSQSAPDPNQAVAEIERLGGKVGRDSAAGSAVVAIDLEGAKVRDADLRHLKGFAKLQTLVLSGTGIGDEGLAHLRGLTGIKALLLGSTRVSDQGLAAIEGLKYLDVLDLHDTRVDDKGLVHLRGLTQLRKVYLGDTRVTAGGIGELQKMLPKLEVSH